MGALQIFFISVGLAMDAFAVSLTEGLALKQLKKRHILKVALTFGVFQGIMPLIGWAIGDFFSDKFFSYSNFISFALLFFIGSKMLYDAWQEKNVKKKMSA